MDKEGTLNSLSKKKVSGSRGSSNSRGKIRPINSGAEDPRRYFSKGEQEMASMSFDFNKINRSFFTVTLKDNRRLVVKNANEENIRKNNSGSADGR